MSRPIKRWSVSSTRANGVHWYYRLSGWANYQSTGLLVERRGGKPTLKSKEAAERYAEKQWYGSEIRAERGQTVAEVLASAYLWSDAGSLPECGYLRQTLTDSAGAGYQHETARGNRSRIRRLVLEDDVAGELAECAPAVWQDWKQRTVARGERDGFGARTVNMTLDHIRGYFQWLVDNGRMSSNPLAGVRSIRDEAEERGIFTAEEMRAMFTNPAWWGYPGRDKQQEKHGAFAFAAPVLIASTLCRPFEIFSITWADVDLQMMSVKLPAVKRVRGNTAGRGRVVPIGKAAAEALGALQRGAPDALVFAGRSRHFYDQRFYAMMRASELGDTDPDGRRRTPYSLKHSMYTYLIDEGADPLTVAELAGHSKRAVGARSLSRTQEHYKLASLERTRKLTPLIDGVMGKTEQRVIRFPVSG